MFNVSIDWIGRQDEEHMSIAEKTLDLEGSVVLVISSADPVGLA